MAEVQLSTVVDLDLVKMKWREQYVSEGLNRKVVPSQPPGIYQGLRIIANTGSPRQVELAPDPDLGQHMAVYQSTTGYSMTYWDLNGSSIILDLSDPLLSNQETVIGLEMDYTIGVDTTANWMAFPIADWNALPAARKDEIVVLGTVQVPNLISDIITTGMISFERATYAWRKLSKGNIPWSPLIRNGGFEQGEFNSTNAWYWDITETAGTGTGTMRVTTANTYTGEHALVVSSVTAGSMTLNARQNVHVPVVPGQLMMVRFYKDVNTTSTVGPSVDLYFGTEDGSTGTILQLPIDVSAVDSSYQEFLTIFAVPNNASSLKWVEIDVITTYSSGPATGFYIDDLQVWLETQGDKNDLQHGVSGHMEVAGRLALRDPDGIYNDETIEITYDETANDLFVGPRSGGAGTTLELNAAINATGNIDSGGSLSSVTTGAIGTDLSAGGTLDITGVSTLRDQIILGDALDADDAGAETPNIIHRITPGATTPRTVIEQAQGDGGTNRYQIMVSDFASTRSLMQNVQYDAAAETFIKDIGSAEAMAYEWTRSRHVIKYREQNADPADITTGFAEGDWRDCMQLRWVEATSRPEIELYNGGVIQWPSNAPYPDGSAYEKNILVPKYIMKAYGSIKTGAGPFMVGGSANTVNFASLTQSGNRQVVTFDVAMDDDDYIVVCNGYSNIHSIFPYKFTNKIEFEAYNSSNVVINLVTSSHVIDYVVFGLQV